MESRAVASSGTDYVIGGFAREALSAALAATHRAGFGPQARVLDGARGDIARQVERIGLRAPWAEPPGPDAVLIVVNAPGRTAIVAELFSRLGAEFVLLAARRGEVSPVADTVAAMSPDIRIGEGAAADG